ncbi:hypothetical protein EPN16_04850 [bacterium]|nr:MAG: hypothetical protein EPN16_04850 [bacterium]
MSYGLRVIGYRLYAAARRICLPLFIICFIFSITGCQSFARKFIRKPKGEPKKEEPIFQPQEYPERPQDIGQLYKDYFLFWESWADEMISYLSKDANFKKQKECAEQALDNLIKMQSLLSETKANSLGPLVSELAGVKEEIFSGSLNSSSFSVLRNKVERIKSRVRREFIYKKIQNDFRQISSNTAD